MSVQMFKLQNELEKKVAIVTLYSIECLSGFEGGAAGSGSAGIIQIDGSAGGYFGLKI